MTWRQKIRGALLHVAVAVGYAALYGLLQQISFSDLWLISGVRLLAVLTVPHRYWPALVIGELGPLAYNAGVSVEDFGWLWAFILVIPRIGLAMPLIWWLSKRLPLYAPTAKLHVGAFLCAAVGMSIIETLASLSAFTAARLPPGYVPPTWDHLTLRYFVGNYLGIMTVTPLLLLIREQWQYSSGSHRWRRLAESQLFLESLFGLLPVLALLVWAGCSAKQDDPRQVAQMCAFLPVIVLAFRHGWHGAAIGGSAASIAVVLMMPDQNDSHTLHAQVAIGVMMTAMMLLGGRIATLYERERQQYLGGQEQLALVQRHVYMGEMHLRCVATSLEQLRASVQSLLVPLIETQYPLPLPAERHTADAPAVSRHTARRQALRHEAHGIQERLYRLADAIYPQMEGLPRILREGSLPHLLDKSGIAYWCDLRGPVSRLSHSLHLAIHRIVCEAVAEACGRKQLSGVSVRVRCGVRQGRGWAVVRLHLQAHPVGLARIHWEGVRPSMMHSASGSGAQAIADRVAIYEGKVRERPTPMGSRISMILHAPWSP